MSGFLLNMINRHQGTVDKVQPRIRSMYEPEPASSVAKDTAFASTASEIVKESLSAGVEMQSAFSRPSNLGKSAPENPPSTHRSVTIVQPAQTDKSFSTTDLNSLDRNRIDSMNEQIQSVLERLGQKSKPTESFNSPNGLQNSVLSGGASDQNTSKVVLNETGLPNSIEETLGRLTSQINNAGEGKRGLQDHAHTLLANAMKTEADPVKIVPTQPERKGEQSTEPLNQSINHQAQTVNTPINSQDGAFQIPAWLTGMQAELNNRWREINAQSKAEPVINVTIGRVEVRAVNAESAKPSPAHAKPRGVLSLDDYLKQRENKGRT